MTYSSIIVMPDGRVLDGAGSTVKSMEEGRSFAHGPLLAKYVPAKLADGTVKKFAETALSRPLAAAYKAARRGAALRAAPEGVANSDQIEHLQLVRLHPELQGQPDDYFYLDAAFPTRSVMGLEYRETWSDTVQTSRYNGRLEQMPATTKKYAEIKYDLPKLQNKVEVPYEDLYRAMISPLDAQISNTGWDMRKTRNDAALAAIQKLPATGNGNGYKTVSSPATITPGNYHSDKNVANELTEWMSNFLLRNDVQIDHIVMSTKTFADYTSNTWTVRGPSAIEPIRMPNGGLAPLPGIPNITAIVDAIVPDDKFYAFNRRNALRLAEGPKRMDRWEDKDRDATVYKITDFNQYLEVSTLLGTALTRKYGHTIDLGTEVTA